MTNIKKDLEAIVKEYEKEVKFLAEQYDHNVELIHNEENSQKKNYVDLALLYREQTNLSERKMLTSLKIAELNTVLLKIEFEENGIK